jgi:cell wall-associated NlpC family hydrolase
MQNGRAIPYSSARPGDLIFYDGHVAMYIGNGQIVHASNSAPYPRGGIKISSATYNTIIGVRRIVD